MKLLIDMFSCQTGSRQRGIGRYSLSLAEELSRLRGRDDMTILANALYPESFEELRQRFIRLLPSGSFLPYYHYALAKSPTQHFSTASRIAETFIEHAYQAVSADFILTPSLFEGWGGIEHGWVPIPSRDYPNQQRAVILYDLIPYVFRQHYLEPDPPLKAWYMERMESLRKFDLLLAISEATRQDAINLLGIEPDRVVNISGAASSHFRKLELSIADRQEWLHRLGISRPFVLYIGGDDFRKNMEGAVRAYARLPREVSSAHQLVLNDVGDETSFRSKVRLLGLADDDIVIFRRRSDEELEVLYNLCKVFMFPSLYEGFGLPILEAMACGAPVIAANNSSLPEVVGRGDALFDASSDESVTDLLHKVLTHDAFRSELADYGPRRAREFSWDRSARLAWQAFRQTHERKKHRIAAAAPGRARLRVAHVSPLPPQKSGVAMYCAGLLPHLAEHVDLDVFTQPGLQVSDPALTGRFEIFPWTALLDRRDDYDAVIYHMGNSELHLPMLDLLTQVPGVVVSHDFFLSNLPFVQEVRSGKRRLFRKTIDESHGLRGLLDYIDRGADKARWDWPMNWRALRNAQELIVHSRHQLDLMEKFYAHGWKPRPTIIRTYRESVQQLPASDRVSLRRKLGLPEEAILFCSFGFMAETKLNHEVIRAFAQARPDLDRKARLIFVGEAEGGEYGRLTQRLLKELDLKDVVDISGYISPAKYQDFLSVADVAIQLRAGSRGETSSAILDCLVHGLATVTNAHGSFCDFPEDVLVRLPEMPAPTDLADAMLRLGADEALRAGLGQRARQYAARAHDPRLAAEQYAEVLRRASQTSEKGIFRLLLEALAELKAPEDIVQATSRLAAAHLSVRAQSRMLIDVSALDAASLSEADRQAASDLVRDLFRAADPSVHLELVHAPMGSLVRASRLIEAILERPRFTVATEEPVYVRPGDVLLMIDVLLPWAGTPPSFFGELRAVGGKVVTLVTSRPDRLASPLAAQSDIFVCASRRLAQQVYETSWRPRSEQVVPQDVIYPAAPDSGMSFELLDPELPALEPAPLGNDSALVSDSALVVSLVQGAGIFGSLNDLLGTSEAEAAATESETLALPLRTENETISTLECTIGIPGENAFSIVVDQDALDDITMDLIKGRHSVPPHYRMLPHLAPAGGTVLDLGAHLGTFALMAAVSGYQVIAVEASPHNAALLEESKRRNGFESLRVVNAAAEDKAGTVRFIDDGPVGKVVMASDGREATIPVPAVAIDALIAEMGLHNVDLIKMDIEGSEVAALQGMSGLLSGPNAPPLIFESNAHTLRLRGQAPGDLVRLLAQYGYSVYQLVLGRLVPTKAGTVQIQCVADCLAVKELPSDIQTTWPVVESLSPEERISLALGEMDAPHPNVRSHIARTLQDLDDGILQDSRVVDRMKRLMVDPSPQVRAALKWWHVPS
jgi:FkbM family methyltransferase